MKVGLVVAAILIGGINMNKSNQLNAMSEVVLANVEALAGSEDGTYDYPDGYPLISKCGVLIEDGWLFDTVCEVTIISCQGGGNGCNEQKCPSHRRD